MDIKRFYSDKKRLKYNPSKDLKTRSGFRKLLSYDDRFDSVVSVLEDLVSSHDGKLKVLDVGVGDAVYEQRIPKTHRKKMYITGIDISEEQLARSKEYIDKAIALDVDTQRFPFNDGMYDLVIISELLEHIFSPDKVLNEACRVLKKGGRLLLTYPNVGAIQLRSSLLIFGKSPLLNYPENQEHIRFFNRIDIISMLPKMIECQYAGLGSFLFQRFNFPIKIITPRPLQVFGNKYLKRLALGHLLLLKK
ncbi:class I SAM-dependent methyltransferase [Patescibacteria group bacterium]